eukprot:1155691-Pelagomonas_calceolata.AAC.2
MRRRKSRSSSSSSSSSSSRTMRRARVAEQWLSSWGEWGPSRNSGILRQPGVGNCRPAVTLLCLYVILMELDTARDILFQQHIAKLYRPPSRQDTQLNVGARVLKEDRGGYMMKQEIPSQPIPCCPTHHKMCSSGDMTETGAKYMGSFGGLAGQGGQELVEG